ncbi:cardiolipin synthase [Bengtsoniella intestinalis]|uniref:cardiolipin synthase n=1 Tax=Bengtsoniella intestinalis TaxID=3073143 RepID=UPI00391F8656
MTRRYRVERRISAATRVMLCLCLFIGQLVGLICLEQLLEHHVTALHSALWMLGVGVAIWLYVRGGDTTYKLAWMSLVLAVPVAGVILFFFWGGYHQKKRLNLKTIPLSPQRYSEKERTLLNTQRLTQSTAEWSRLATYWNKRDCPLYGNTTAQYFPDGSAFYADLRERIEQAETYVFLEYYILADGKVWSALFDVLSQKAAQGIEIYIIFDDFGNIARLSDKRLQQMQDAGMEVAVFNPVHQFISRLYFNYRNHRKIAVIDGYYAYTGGVNIGDEYANLIPRYGHWKDSAVRLDGEAAYGFASQFIQMWRMLGGTLGNEDDFYRPRMEMPKGKGYCQPFFDGPLQKPDCPSEATYLRLIHSAKRLLYITTPYYAVEDSVQQALCMAADSGVDVRLMIPAIPDHKTPYLVAETYWGELLQHGVKIYKYVPGFLHAKSVMVDREVALIGSTNMDYRTFHLHYECGVICYQMEVIEDLLEDMDNILTQSAPYTLEDWNKRSMWRRFTCTLMRLFAVWL